MMNIQPPSTNQNASHFNSPRRRGTACNRCRLQKVRCNNQQPVCSNCVKAGAECVKSRTIDVESKNYIKHLEKRVQDLENTLKETSHGISVIGQQQENRGLDPITFQMEENASATTMANQHPTNTAFNEVQNNTTRLDESSRPVTVLSSTAESQSPTASVSSQIGPGQPLAHGVGLLSLANSTEPKYLGPSSGVTFARLIFAAAPQSQGLSGSWLEAEKGLTSKVPETIQLPVKLAELPAEDELHYFFNAYFEMWHPLYPFLDEHHFQDQIRNIYAKKDDLSSQPLQNQESLSNSADLAQLFLILALGAKILESRLSTNFSSDQYYATAMFHVAKISLHDSTQGVQILLLLVLCSFSFTNGLNAWFLTSTIIASCLDLGLQRKHIENRRHCHESTQSQDVLRIQKLRSAIFWSVYSLDRTLCVILGRPLTLRDEAIDIEYPGQHESQEIDFNAVKEQQQNDLSPNSNTSLDKRDLLLSSPFTSAIYSFRFDRITAEIKLMLYRVAQSPSRFPWPTNLVQWQKETFEVCKQILEDARRDLKWRRFAGRSGLSDRTITTIELKYHQCVMLLYRPSPALPQPLSQAMKVCYDSAMETIRIQFDLHRFANMVDSWLTAHAVFVSGITLLYCLWTSPQIRRETNFQAFMLKADACTALLAKLGKTWSVSKTSQQKFERLVQLTAENWNKTQFDNITPANTVVPQEVDSNSEATRSNVTVPFSRLDDLPPNFWDTPEIDYYHGPSIILDELGDMGNWFDLDWLAGANNYNFQTNDVSG